MTFDREFYKNLSNINPQSLVSAVQGGITIAIAASLYFTFYGCILGMSGLVGTLLKAKRTYEARRALTIICGLIFSSSMVFYMNQQNLTTFHPFDKVVQGTRTQLVMAGFLVGAGTQLASGCTSGHGLCGLPRLSLRSITAVMIFLLTGIITATFDLNAKIPTLERIQIISVPNNVDSLYYMLGAPALPILAFLLSGHKSFSRFIRTIVYFFIGSIFGMGLMLAGMSQRQKIHGFLQLNKKWDPSLLVVLMSGVLVNLIIFTFMRKAIKKPFYQDKFSDPRGHIDWKLIIGSFLFGLGWGIGGLCPGPFLLLAPLTNLTVPLFWGVSFIIGMKFSQIINGVPSPNTQIKLKPS